METSASSDTADANMQQDVHQNDSAGEINAFKPIRENSSILLQGNSLARRRNVIGVHNSQNTDWTSIEIGSLKRQESLFWSKFVKMPLRSNEHSLGSGEHSIGGEDGDGDKMDIGFSKDVDDSDLDDDEDDQVGEKKSRNENIELRSAVTCVHYSPKNWRSSAASANDGCGKLAITSGSRVMVYDAKTMKLSKSITRFKDAAYSAQVRFDGALLCAGSESGDVMVFNIDLPGSSLLRTFTGEHKAATKVVRWNVSYPGKLASGSDDKTAKVWDVTSENSLATFRGHGDYVRALANISGSDQWVTGSYDHKVRLFDERTVSNGSSLFTFDHGAPVESVLALPGGSAILSSGGDTIKVWDIISGNQAPIHSFSNHQKTITSICSDADGKRILSASLDSLVKVYDMSNYGVVHTFRMPGPILSMSISNDNSRFAVGTANGLLTVRERRAPPPRKLPLPLPIGGSKRFFVRGRDEIPSQNEIRIRAPKVVKLKKYDKYLRSFSYQDALDAVLETRDPNLVVAMLEELINREGLDIALAGRDEESLEPILAFLVKYTTHPRYCRLLSSVCQMVLNVYANLLGQSPMIDGLIVKLSKQVGQEVSLQRGIMRMSGVIDLLLTSSSS